MSHGSEFHNLIMFGGEKYLYFVAVKLMLVDTSIEFFNCLFWNVLFKKLFTYLPLMALEASFS